MLIDAENVIAIMSGIFDDLGIPYLIGGSVASGIHGTFRYTNDIDFVADVKNEQVDALMVELAERFYLDRDAIFEAIKTQTSFSMLFLANMTKVDVFLIGTDGWHEEVWKRRVKQKLAPQTGSKEIWIYSAEDMILQKLLWFKIGNEVSDRQWGDVQGMLKVQSNKLDYKYMENWAAELGLAILLTQSIMAAGIEV